MSGRAPPPSPWVLLVEDDPSILRFVGLALEDLPVRLVQAESLASARAQLARQDFVLVICDLMLPDGSGLDLIEDLLARRNGVRVAAFSAGLAPAARQRLQGLGIWRILAKPASLSALEACVTDALAQVTAAPAAPARAATAAADGSTRALQQAVADYFAGDAGLHAEFLAGCRRRFADDLQAGERAVAQGDLAALHRIAHSLKTVLPSLGWPSAGALAADLERSAASGQAEAAGRAWRVLHGPLAALADDPPAAS